MSEESSSSGFLALTRKPFQFGTQLTSLEELLGSRTLGRFRRKFKSHTDLELFVGIREMVRFLYLASHSPSSVFFPGDTLVDDLWHALITETQDYQDFCNRLGTGRFIHHSGVPFAEYTSNKSPAQVHEEQCSWLASYIINFGPIDSDAFACLNLAQSLAKRLNGDLSKVNQLGHELINLTESNSEKEFDFHHFVAESVASQANVIDANPMILSATMRTLAGQMGNPSAAIRPFTNDHLEILFGASTALAFTFWQHLAAVERLEGLPDWQIKNQLLWEELSSGSKLCGLATTQLANPAGAGIKAQISEGGFLLTGKAPWVCGYKIFDLLLIGFDCGESIAFAIIPFPNSSNLKCGGSFRATQQKMACLNGSNTVELEFKDFFVSSQALVSERFKNSSPPAPRPTKYLIPEIGIAKAAVKRIEKLVEKSEHPRHKLVASHIGDLKTRIESLDKMKAQFTIDELTPIRDEINRDAIRVLALALGAKAILADSHIPRLQTELILLDSVIQSPITLERKIASTSRGTHG